MAIFSRSSKKSSLSSARRMPATDKPSGSAPVVRYYRPSNNNDSQRRRTNSKSNNQEIRNNNAESSNKTSVIKIIYRWFGVAIILFALSANTMLSGPVVKVVSYDSSNPSYKSQKAYSEAIEAMFSSSVLNKSKFTLSSTKLEQQIKEKFPEVDHAVAVIPLAGRQLQVGLKLSKPLARLQQNGSNTQAVLSSSGVVLDVEDASYINTYFSKLPIVSIPNINFKTGDAILTSDEVALVDLLIAEFDGSEAYRYKVVSIEFDIQKREIRVKFEGVDFYAKLTPERQSREQIGALVVSVKNLLEQGKLPKSYIDVRVEDRVFIK